MATAYRGAENRPDRRGDGASLLVAEELRMSQVLAAPTRLELATSRRHHVPDPLRVCAVGEGDHITPWDAEDVDGGAVLAPRPPTGVHYHAEAGQAWSQGPGHPVGNSAVDGRHPSPKAMSGSSSRASEEDRVVTVPRGLGIAIASAGALFMIWSLVGQPGLPEASPRRFRGAMSGALVITIGVFVLVYWG
jgi:hypothetical protein